MFGISSQHLSYLHVSEHDTTFNGQDWACSTLSCLDVYKLCLNLDFSLPTSLHFTLIKQESQSFSVGIEDDDETEVSETFVLSLLMVNSTDTVLIHPDILNITITDNDGKHLMTLLSIVSGVSSHIQVKRGVPCQ